MLGKKAAYWFRRAKKDSVMPEKLLLVAEIRQAHSDWVSAQMRLDWVVEKDQIDYAIFALETAEKRYEMLLRQAKQLSWNDAAEFTIQGGA